MAYCPKCSGTLDADSVVCPHCGYDFPSGSPDHRRGIVYSPLATLALATGTVVAGLGSATAVFVSVEALLNGKRSIGLFWGPLAFFLLLAQMVVFVRVQQK